LEALLNFKEFREIIINNFRNLQKCALNNNTGRGWGRAK
jgi:hypothetical protein